MEVAKNDTFVLDVAPCSLVDVCKRFGRTLLNLYEITQRHISEDTVKADTWKLTKDQRLYTYLLMERINRQRKKLRKQFFFRWLFHPIQGPGLLFSSVIICSQIVGLLDEWSGRRKTATPTQNKRIHTPNIHVLSGIRTHDPSVGASEDSSYLRPRRYCDRSRKKQCNPKTELNQILRVYKYNFRFIYYIFYFLNILYFHQIT
jgi:hypothetical protein